MKIGSLFSGAGGLDMAVEHVFGGEVIWQSEVDKAASTVLAHRFPGVPNLGDITTADFNNVEPVDVICGGFPCQDVSAAGKRAGIKQGTRSGLWSIFADVIDQLGPTWVVIENVRGLLSARAHRGVEPTNGAVGDGAGGPVLRAAGAVLGDLADLGYDAQWTTIAASSVGAPHRRERVFIVASIASGAAIGQQPGRASAAQTGQDSSDRSGDHRGERSDIALLPTPQRRDGEAGASKTVGGIRPSGQPRQKDLNTVTVRELGVERGLEPIKIINGEDDGAVSIFPCDGGSEDSIVAATDGEGVAVDVCGAENSHNSCVPEELAGTKHKITLLPTPTTQDGANNGGPSQFDRNTLPLNAVAALLPTPAASDCTGGGSHPDRRVNADGLKHGRSIRDYALLHNTDRWGKYAPAIARWQSLTRPAPAPTEPNKNGNPRLSAAFSEWMMGWPDGWVTDPDIGISRNDQLRIVGNGVCPQQAIAALTWLLQVAEVAA